MAGGGLRSIRKLRKFEHADRGDDRKSECDVPHETLVGGTICRGQKIASKKSLVHGAKGGQGTFDQEQSDTPQRSEAEEFRSPPSRDPETPEHRRHEPDQDDQRAVIIDRPSTVEAPPVPSAKVRPARAPE